MTFEQVISWFFTEFCANNSAKAIQKNKSDGISIFSQPSSNHIGDDMKTCFLFKIIDFMNQMNHLRLINTQKDMACKLNQGFSHSFLS